MPQEVATIRAVPRLLKVRCRVCGKFRDPREFVHDHVVGFCWRCLEWHREALDFLAGNLPKACHECGLDLHQLQQLQGSGDLPMRIYVKDGIYELLCVRCGDVYEQKRRDLFGGTPYGEARGIAPA